MPTITASTGSVQRCVVNSWLENASRLPDSDGLTSSPEPSVIRSGAPSTRPLLNDNGSRHTPVLSPTRAEKNTSPRALQPPGSRRGAPAK